MYKAVKRLFDILLSILLFPLVLVLIVIVGAAIKIEDGGPVFYLSDRLGKDGRIFKMYKFRSMKVNAPDIRYKDGSTYSSDSDDRVTKVGKFVRKTSIDEIPQALNVFKGDMSFVGPRPDTPAALNSYTDEERSILTVRPGITGYNQVVNRVSVGSKEKLRYDIIYINKMSFLFDLKIILLTVKCVLFSRNIYRDETVFENEDAVIDKAKQGGNTSV